MSDDKTQAPTIGFELDGQQRERIALLEGFDDKRTGLAGVWLSHTAILNVTAEKDGGIAAKGWKWEQGSWKDGCDYDIAGDVVKGVFRSAEKRKNWDVHVVSFVQNEFLPHLKALAQCQSGVLCRDPAADSMTFVDSHQAAFASHGNSVTAEIEPIFFVTRFGFEHAVAGFFRPAGFGNDDRQRVIDPFADPFKNTINSVRIGIVQIMNSHPVSVSAKCVGNKLRTESGAANPN